MENVLTTYDTDNIVEGEELSNPMEEALLTDPLAPSCVLVPLDSRPCNWLYPIRMADIAGVRLHVPPLEYLGWRDRAGDPVALLDWLDALPKAIDGILISLDALLYGGLVQSRKPGAQIKTPGEIAGFVARFLRERPGCRLHVMKTIPRVSSTVLRTSDLPIYKELWRIGLQDKIELPNGTSQPTDSDNKLESDVPKAKSDILTSEQIETAWKEHLAAREMNKLHHAELLSELLPMTTSWCIAVEDGHAKSAQVPEIDELLSSAPTDLKNKIAVVYGCDEQGMVMLARHLRDKIEGRLPLGLWWTFSDSIKKIAKFEGIGVSENLARFMQHLRISPIDVELSTWSNEPSVVLGTAPEEIASRKTPLLILHNFDEEQLDHIVDGKPIEPPKIEGMWAIPFLSSLLLSEKVDIYLADFAWANGGDPLLDAVFSQGNGNYLQGYSSWNTAGNTIGKILAQFVCRAYRKTTDIRGWDSPLAIWSAERYKFETLLTDRWFPQIIRRKLWNLVIENGGDPWSFDLYTLDFVEKRCKELHKPVKASYEGKHRAIYRGRGYVVPQTIEPDITFPWNRLFEIDLRVHADKKYMAEIATGSIV